MPDLKQQVADLVQDMGHQPESGLVNQVYGQLAGDYLDQLCDTANAPKQQAAEKEAEHGRVQKTNVAG